MILLTDINGCKHAVSTDAISRVSEPSTSAHWHGIHSYVHLFDGEVISARQHVNEILRLIAEEKDNA
ncbi:hypothetical protein CJP16_03500 [Aeromonas sobria]|uniref:Uncharacterized protein n=1 Tax=Aeromonas sobria TaxID=646 RepID=A0A2N3J605_AERSO|nr:hypothetical protein CJP16_03500 [Aeromonas sobria]